MEPEFYYSFLKSPPLVPILDQMIQPQFISDFYSVFPLDWS
jgi:hypothetical protein